MTDKNSDQHLQNLRKVSEVDPIEANPPPPTTPSQKGRGKGRQTRKPNNRNANTRVSARRIGGPNYGAEFDALRQQRMVAAAQANSSGGNLHTKKSIGSSKLGHNSTTASGLMPVNLGRTNSQSNSTATNLVNPVLPRVQELGSSLMGGRRSSSRIGLSLIDRARSNSSVSNHSANEKALEPKEAIIRYGELLKKGVLTQQWKKRFFVLTDRHLLYYLDAFDVPQELHQIDIAPRGQVELAIVDEIKKDKADKSGSTFNLVTPARVYRMRVENQGDANGGRIAADAWVASISGARENNKQQLLGAAPRGSFASLKVDEVDSANQSASTYKHPAKRLIDQERFAQKTGPHKPAALEEYEDWTPFDVAAWLYTVHLQKYSESFYKQGVDGKKLKGVEKHSDAAALGVEEGDLDEFFQGIETLKALNELGDEPF